MPPLPPPLRPSQLDAVQAFLERRHLKDSIHVASLPTGAGKTRAAIELGHQLVADNYRVLILTRNWGLVRQIGDELNSLFPQTLRLCSRLGGYPHELGGNLVASLPDRVGSITLTTLPTLYARRGELPDELRKPGKLAVIWDEVHWAANSRLGQFVRQLFLGRATMFGLSATPVVKGPFDIAYSVEASGMWGKDLAMPRLFQLQTGIRWSPVLGTAISQPVPFHNLGKTLAATL